MKNVLKSLLFVALAATMTACEIDKLDADIVTPEQDEVGYLKIGDVMVNLDTEHATTQGEPKTATRATTEAATSYYVFVSDAQTGVVAWEGTYADAVSQSIALEPGTYVVSARQTQDGTIAGVAQDAPYYAGSSDEVVVKTKETSTATVTCKLANILTTVELSADLKASFKEYDATSEKRLKTNVKVGTDAASNAYDFEASSTHETPKMYFRDEAGLNSTTGNTMVITLSGDYYTGSVEDITAGTIDETLWKEVKMTKTLTNVRAAQWRKISINISHPTTGNVQFEITVESYIYDEEITVDVVTLYETLNIEEAIPDEEEENEAAPDVTINGQEDLNYAINSSLYDEDAEAWTSFLKLNVTPKDDTTVASIYAVVNSDNAALMSAIAAYGEENGLGEDVKFNLFPTNDLTTYCNVATDGQTITVKAAGMDALYKYAGTHTVSLYTVDSENRMKHTDVVITVTSTAQAPTIVWMKDGVDVIDQVHTLTAENSSSFECKVDMTSVTGFTKLEVDIVSSVLTDEELQGVGLGSHIDLVNPSEDQIGVLQGLGFLGEGVTSLGGATSASFDISGFMGMLYALFQESDHCYFNVTAGDAGGETTKSLQFYMQVE